MNIKEFIENCNISPLFKKKLAVKITRKLLSELDFVKKDYNLNCDVLELERRVFFAPPSIISNKKDDKSKKQEVLRDMQHAKIVSIYSNQKLLKKVRRDLKMPFDNRGFILPNKNVHQKNYINVLLKNLGEEYKNWLLNFIDDIEQYNKSARKKVYVADALNKELEKHVSFLLKKWNLSSRYYDAIIELILFNRIIPADPNITFRSNFLQLGAKPRMSIEFDVDTTKTELINFIEKDPFGLFTGKKKVIHPKLKRTSKKNKETEEMIEIFNKEKGEGKYDKYAYNAISNKLWRKDYKPATIRKRIKGK